MLRNATIPCAVHGSHESTQFVVNFVVKGD